MVELPPPPRWRRLDEGPLRDKLGCIRGNIAPILNRNNLPDFTDHSVAHSDQVCNLVDELTVSLENTRALSVEEAFVLYASCYLHDAGLQNQNAGETDVIQRVLTEHDSPWHQLDPSTRRLLTREHHHRISAEMVLGSVRSQDPIIREHLDDEHSPDMIANLCAIHAVEFDSLDYQALSADRASIRMRFLSALLRTADILDESRQRSNVALEQIVDLDLTARMHWWRHHYVREVLFDQQVSTITICFEFPESDFNDYAQVVPELQVPHIKEEFEYHTAVLAEQGIHWLICGQTFASTTLRRMPSEVHARMAAELVPLRQRRLEVERLAALSQLREHRALIRRQIDEIKESETAGNPDESLIAYEALAEQLWNMGGRREAWMLLSSEYNRLRSSASANVIVDVAISLCTKMVEDNSSSEALTVLHGIAPVVASLPDTDQRKRSVLRLRVRGLIESCNLDEGLEQILELMRTTDVTGEHDDLQAQRSEIQLLSGNLDRAADTLDPGEHRP